jgi:very-short-patch-repair endonuclease
VAGAAGRSPGVAFKRQVVLGGRYIVDSFAASERLVVEVDGGCHRSSCAADRRREEKLRRLGVRVVRVDAGLALGDVEAALQVVRNALSRRGNPELSGQRTRTALAGWIAIEPEP